MPFPSWLPILLGVLTAVGPISTDMYLPAFPAIEATFGGQAGSAQITLATWFLGLAIGQITQGPLSDRFGRRGPLLAGTLLFTVASAGCALAPSLGTLSLMRLLAALGGSAGMVVPRAIIRDLADGHAAARMMSRLMLVMGAAPILAPTLGGLVLKVADWHAIFWFTAAYGAACCVAVWWKLPDTLPPQNRVKLGVGAQLSRYIIIFRERGFLSHACLGGFAMFGLFAYIGGAPDVFINRFHLSPSAFGLMFGGCAMGLILASQTNPRLLRRFGASRLLRLAVRIFVAATLVLTVLAFAKVGPWWLLALPILVSTSCMGITLPNATVGALSRHAGHAGSASALMGTMQYGLGAVSGVLVGAASDGTARPMALLMLFGACAAAVGDLCRPVRA
jgi:DHA1 family bicyclomycin/chloramphenicol resistance-like MFS transporter